MRLTRPTPTTRAPVARSRGFPRPLLLPALALALPLSMLAINGWMSWRSIEREMSGEMIRAADAGAEYVARVLAGYSFALNRVVDLVHGLSDAEITNREAELHGELRRMIRELPQAEAAYVIDRVGVPILAASMYPVPRAVATAADRSFFLSLSGPNPPALHVSEVYRSRFDDVPFFALSRRRDGREADPPLNTFTGLVNVSVFPGTIGSGLRHFLLRPDDALALVLLDGQMIARTSPPLSGLPMHTAPVAEDFEQSLALDTISVADGARQMLARRRVAGFPLMVAARRSRSTLLDEWRRAQLGQWAFGLPVTLALFLFSVKVSRDRGRLGVELTESEAWLRRTTEGAGIGIWEHDPAAHTITGSRQCYKLWGFDPAQGPPGWKAILARLAPEWRAPMLAMMASALTTGRARLEYAIHLPREGQPPEVLWRMTEAHRVRGKEERGAPVLVGITYDITQRRAAEERVAQILHRAVDEQEAERLRLARDLHDGLGQHLALLHLELAALARDGDSAARRARLEAISNDLGKEVNRLAHAIRPTAIDDIGFPDALRQMVEQWSQHTGLQTELILRLPPARLPLPVETTLYRIAQEALTNIAKHAEARRVGIVIGFEARSLRMVIEDDGRGMSSTEPPQPTQRFGLRGIRERLELLGGSLEIESSPGAGTTLIIEMPV